MLLELSSEVTVSFFLLQLDFLNLLDLFFVPRIIDNVESVIFGRGGQEGIMEIDEAYY